MRNTNDLNESIADRKLSPEAQKGLKQLQFCLQYVDAIDPRPISEKLDLFRQRREKKEMKVFYIRCSTIDQNEARQLQMAEDAGADKLFIEKASGKNTDRQELQKMLSFVREGDTVITESISRIARNTRDLLSIVSDLTSKGVEFVSLKENIDTTTPQGRFMLTVFGALAELERENLLQRQAEGIAIAKSNNVYKGRKAIEIDEKKFKAMCAEWRNGERTAVSIQKAFGFSAPTFYAKVKERNL